MPKNHDEIITILIEMIKSVSNTAKDIYGNSINEETKFQSDLGFDSLMSMDLAGRVEQYFKISIKESELSSIKTVKDLAENIHAKK